jgi:hypothetical protein
MWISENDGLKWAGIVQTVRSAEKIDAQRKNLENHLLNRSWDSIHRPWMKRKDSLFQFKDDRIFVDDIGVFMYRHTRSGWHRFAGFSGYDRKIILWGFDRWAEKKA